MSFKSDFKNFISGKLATQFSSSGLFFKVVNDATQYLSGGLRIQDNECLMTISLGNATIDRYDSFVYHNGSFSFIFLIPYNKKDDVVDGLDTLFETMTTTDTLFTIGTSMYAKFNINTCSADGAIHLINGVQYTAINVIGTISYSNKKIDGIALDTVKFNLGTTFYANYQVLNNVISIQYLRNPDVESHVILNNRFKSNFIVADSQTIIVDVLLDLTDTVHQYLNEINKMIPTSSVIKDAQVGTVIKQGTTYVIDSQQMLVSTDTTYKLGNFTIMRITLSR